MFKEEKNLKDPRKDSEKDISSIPAPYLPPWRDGLGTYTKTDKLITALYMVTDIIDKNEPLRNKLRILGVEILSDIISMTRLNLVRNIQGILSFLDIAFTMNMISEMNKNILINEFTQLKNSLIVPQDNPVWLEEFLMEKKEDKKEVLPHNNSIGHHSSTSIGVQKGSTLLKALNEKMSNKKLIRAKANDFDILKKQRRDEIIDFIQKKGGNTTITDIKNGAYSLSAQGGSLTSCSEKTLQRELISMVKDGLLNKTGEKRWSRYFLIN